MINDETVIRDIKNGKIESFSFVVKAYMTKISRFVFSRVFNKDDAEDIIQDSFIHFYQAIRKFDESLPILPYLYQIARNEMKMYYRSHKNTLPLNEDILSSKDDYSGIQEESIDDIINTLPPDRKNALLLLSKGFSYQEIADKMKKPINSIRTLIRRARLQLIQSKKYEQT